MVLTALMPEDLGYEGMGERVDTITHLTLTKDKQPQAMSELSHHQATQSFKLDHALPCPQPTQDQG